MPTPDMRRRRWLGAASSALLAPWARLSLAAPAAGPDDARFVLVLLRGGMDGLMAVPAPGDPAFGAARGPLAASADGALPLAGPFALHPLLGGLHRMFGQGEALVLHATGLPYHERSHFDAQQVLESGGSRPHELTSGWLGRALQATGRRGVALASAVPLALRGSDAVDTWSPSALPGPAPDLVARVATLYAADPALAAALRRSQALRDDPAMTDGMAGARGAAAPLLARKAAEMLRAETGARVAMLELGGWDSHVNQAAPQGQAANALRTLDNALTTLREALLEGDGRTWTRCVVLVATEFGREVAGNGTGGTDHGSGGAAFVLGGALRGGRVIADWPGLAPRDRFEGRDLRITTDLRSALRTVLLEHLRVPRAAVDRDVLPGSAALPALELLYARG